MDIPVSNKETMETREKIDELLQAIRIHNDQYRKGHPIVSDSVYDREVEMLRELDPDNEWFKKIEPVPVGAARKVSLPLQMKSLYKVKDIAELKEWISGAGLKENDEVIIMPKFDGLSLLCNESTGEAYSRGGSENEGQDCTLHLKKNGAKRDTAFRYTYGEFVFGVKKWMDYFAGRINVESGEKWKSPRNTAAGLLNRDIPSDLLKYVDFYRYGTDEETLKQYRTFEEVLTSLCDTYSQPKYFTKRPVKDIDGLYLADAFKTWRKEYYIDGLVIYANDLTAWGRLGRHKTTGNPMYAIAYKHPDFTESFETCVTGVTWNVSKSGALKPVVNIEKVDTGECEMDSPTGYNASWIRSMHIAAGAKIIVTRSGGVIPKILETLDPAPFDSIREMWDEVAVCPCCGQPTKWSDSYVELVCDNPLCPGTREAKIMFFFSTCGAENMGDETVSKMYQSGLNSINSILHATFEQLLRVDGIGETFANTIMNNNKRILNDMELPTIMQASDCFQGIGKIKAKQILDSLDKSAQDLIYANEPLMTVWPSKDELEKMNKTNRAFWNGIGAFQNFINQTGIKLNRPEPQSMNIEGKCKGMAVCFSGIRDVALEAYITSEGGSICAGITKKTTHLVVKDPGSRTSKIIKAKECDIPIVSIDDFKRSLCFMC